MSILKNSFFLFFSSLAPQIQTLENYSQHNFLTYKWTLCIENWLSNNNPQCSRINLLKYQSQPDRSLSPFNIHSQEITLSFSQERVLLAYRIRRKTVLDALLTRAFILVTNNVIESRSWDRRATGSALPVFVLLRSPSRRNLDRKRCAQTIAESSMEMQTNLKWPCFVTLREVSSDDNA